MSQATKRKQLLVNPDFQLSFIAYMLGIALSCMAVLYYSHSYYFWKFIEKGQSIGLAEDHAYFQFIKNQHDSMNLIFYVTAFLTFSIIMIGGLYISHRVAGPIYKLKKHMLSKKGGPIRFRQKDYFQDLAKAWNDSVGKSKSTTVRAKRVLKPKKTTSKKTKTTRKKAA